MPWGIRYIPKDKRKASGLLGSIKYPMQFKTKKAALIIIKGWYAAPASSPGLGSATYKAERMEETKD